MKRLTHAVAATAALSGCADICVIDVSGSVGIVAEPDANEGSAIAVDVVAVQGEALGEMLGALSAGEYFLSRSQILRDNADRIEISSWEIAPSQAVEPERVSFECGVDDVFVFASYRSPGVHRVRLPDLDDVLIRLGPTDFEVSQ